MSGVEKFLGPAPFEQILSQRLRWMVRLRWLAGIGILITVALADRLTTVEYVKGPLFAIVAFIFIYNLALEYRLTRLGPHPARRQLFFFANLQIALDFISLFLLVTFTGGVQNLFVFYVVFHVVISSILLPPKNAAAVSVLICLAFALLFLADYHGLVPAAFRLRGFLPEAVHHNAAYVFGLTYIFGTVVIVTSYMAITISISLRDAERRMLALTRELERQGATCEQRNLDLIEFERKKSAFFSLAAHQLRAPLGRVREIAEQVSSAPGKAVSEDHRRGLGGVGEQVGVMLDLVDDMLECARLTDLEHGLPREDIDLSALARAALEAAAPEAEAAGVAIESEIASVPIISGDPLGWPKVFSNLLENAVRYSPRGSTVRMGLTRDFLGEWITGEVTDQGMGMAPEELGRIFQEFYRAPAAADAAPGTGLGLYITRRIIELHGGSIQAESKKGRGSSFKFSIPATGRAART